MQIITEHYFSPCFFKGNQLLCSNMIFQVSERNLELVLQCYNQNKSTFKVLGLHELEGCIFCERTIVILDDGEKLIGKLKNYSEKIVFGKRMHTLMMQAIKMPDGRIIVEQENILTTDEYNEKYSEDEKNKTTNKTYQKNTKKC